MHTHIAGVVTMISIMTLLLPIPFLLLLVFLPKWPRFFVALALYGIYVVLWWAKVFVFSK